MTFTKVGGQVSLSKKIEIEIEKAIRKGQIPAGTRLPTENELCEQFSVSRTAIREAISKLSARGLLYVRKGSGTYVSEISFDRARHSLNLFFELSTAPDLTLDTINARLMMEPNIAAYAATVRTSKHVEILEANMDKMIACPLGDLEREAELDNEFHSEIIKSTNNEVVALLMRPVYSLMSKFRNEVFVKSDEHAIEKEKQILLDYHQSIFLGIKNQDPEKVRLSMTAHLKHTQANYLKKRS